MIVDLKYIRDIEPIWDEFEGMKVSFIRYWGYDIQGAIYQKVDRRSCPFVIVTVTKEAEPNIEALYVPDTELSAWIGEVEQDSARYAAIKRGEIEPRGCGKCAYCRNTKKLNSIKDYLEVCI